MLGSHPGKGRLGTMSSMQNLLMIGDHARLAHMAGEYLQRSGFGVTHAPDATAGLALLQEPGGARLPDLVVLDLMLPHLDGLEVCRRIRAMSGEAARIPVLMLTAKGDPMDRVVGLEIGADDYLPKPFEPRELLARLRAVLRRPRLADASTQDVLRFGRLDVDRGARSVRVEGRAIGLTAYQF